MGLKTGPLLLLLFPLLAKRPPLLLLPSELLDFLPRFVLDLFLFQLFVGNKEDKLLAVLLFLSNSILVDRQDCAELCDSTIQLRIFVLNPEQALIEVGLFPEEPSDIALSLEALFADQVVLVSD